MLNIAPETLPAAQYRDPALYQIERREIFARGWLLLAHESQLPRPGSYVALHVAGFPLLVVRDEQGQIRCFHNVCRHRAGPLTQDGAGDCGAQLTCRYHGWRYKLDGRLAAARDFGPAEGFDPRNFSLFPLNVQTWRGFIFANMEKEPEPFSKTMAPLEEAMRAMDVERFTVPHLSTHDIACNWKTYVENYLEGYHIPVLHPSLSASIDTTYELDLKPPVMFYRTAPLNGSAVAGLWAWAWPCLGVNVYADGILMERMWPLSHDRTRLDYLFLFAEGTSPERIRRAVDASVVTTLEDKEICEDVQRNLDAGIYETGRLSPKHESAVAWFQGEIRGLLNT